MVYIYRYPHLARDLEAGLRGARQRQQRQEFNATTATDSSRRDGNTTTTIDADGCSMMCILLGLACLILGLVFLPQGLKEHSKLPPNPNDVFLQLDGAVHRSTTSSSYWNASCKMVTTQYQNETRDECCGGGNNKQWVQRCYEHYQWEYNATMTILHENTAAVAAAGSGNNNNSTTTQKVTTVPVGTFQQNYVRAACDESNCDQCSSMKGPNFPAVSQNRTFSECWALRSILQGQQLEGEEDEDNDNSDNDFTLTDTDRRNFLQMYDCHMNNNPHCVMPMDPKIAYKKPAKSSRANIIAGSILLGCFVFFLAIACCWSCLAL